MRRLIAATAISLLALAGFSTSASAAPITIGSPLTAPFGVSSCGEPCTTVATAFNEPGAVVTSPVDGTIVRWHILKGSPGFNYRLRVITPSPGLNFTGAGTSAPANPSGFDLQTFSTNLPIKAGQMIGLDLEGGAPIGFLEAPTDSYAFFQPPLLDGQTGPSELLPGEVSFNAEIQRPPAISAISPASGSFKGGTPVTITGSEFTGATAVSFGSLPAQSFAVVSDGQINAVAPATTKPGTLPITVTTAAGAGTSAIAFKSQACKVPQLQGKKLKGAKKRARKALCKIGKIKKIEGATAKTGRVVKQKPKPGKLLAPGAKIKITLAP